MNYFTIFLYAAAAALAALSFIKDRNKTLTALKKAWRSFEGILPQLLAIILLVSASLAYLEPRVISRIVGSESGWAGVLIASAVGAVALIPGFIAFPTAALLLQSGAGLMQMGAFVSSLMMVGVVTAPVEARYFGKRATLLRNGLAYLCSLFVAWVIGRVVR